MEGLRPPFMTDFGWAMIALIIMLVLFHLMFLWLWKLSKLQWKVVDYIWISIGIIALYAAVGLARQQYAQYFLESSQIRVQYAASQVKDALTTGELVNCVHFNQDVNSPEGLEHLQKSKDAICAWFLNAHEKLKESAIGRESIKIEIFGNPPPEKGYDWILLEDRLNGYNQAVADFKRNSTDAEKNGRESLLTMLLPCLLALALALRLTKVTAELKDELSNKSTFKRTLQEMGVAPKDA